MHRLERELYELVQSDTAIFDFIERSSLDGMWYWDIENPEHEWMSPNFWLTLGYDPSTKQHLASEWQDIINQDDLALAFENFTKHCEDKHHPYEQIVRYTHKLGHTVWIQCRGVAIRDENGKAIRMLGAHTDITKIKNSEEKLKETIKSRELFFARMSHEIRTPLHGIIGLTDIIQARNNDPLLAKEIDTIATCGEQLLTLLDDLLTLSKLNDDNLKVSIEEVPVKTIIDYVANLYQARAQAKSLEFIVDIPSRVEQLSVITDKIRITQVISNLVNNAIKFTSNGSVTLRVTPKGDSLEIAVIDTGRGIKDTDKVFDAYRQELSDESDTSGTGLGLEIVQRICRELKHELHLSSELDKGTQVVVGCPMTIRMPVQQHTSTSPGGEARKLGKVLVVDDNEINREIALVMLSSECERVDVAEDGNQAIAQVRKHKDYDYILMDLNMPVRDGYQAAVDILGMQDLPIRPKIFAVSADAFDETIERCKQVGMQHHVKKPFTKERLVTALLNNA